MEIFIALVCIAVFLWIAWRWQHTSIFEKLGIPGPKPNLIFGNLLELYKKGPIKCHEEWVKKYGRVLGYYYGMKPVLLVTDPYLLKDIFIKDFHKFINREPFDPLLGSVPFPHFLIPKMKQMAGSINSSIDNMMNSFRERAEKGEEFEIFDVYQRLTLDVITKTAIRQDSTLKSPSKLISLSITVTFPSLRRLCLKLEEIKITLLNKGRAPHKVLREGIRDVMELRRSNPQTRKNDLLQLMLDTTVAVEATEMDVSKLEAGNVEVEKLGNEETTGKKTRAMTDAEIESSAFTVLLAGYETTSTALGFTTYLLAKHQDVQENLYQEIKQMTDRGRKLEPYH
ncbi:cytochrome P450 3A8 [Trichonephila inaurata madagascariensis]|uniref:Cytochrome P450 3A8 n=1 Tax=Trichonephila inaurata madagascariensis TaxID=2747483 RepID=A0A8X6XA65_9ARAC|nr:cytochrome P450 3A8 [Trichonephila inaurata madagascariensis]